MWLQSSSNASGGISPLFNCVHIAATVRSLDDTLHRDTVPERVSAFTADVNHPNPEQARWFSEEVHPHEGALRAHLGRSLASRDDVDDVVQDSFLKIWRSRASGLVRSPKAFLFAIARNAALDLRRRRSVASMQAITENASLPVLEDSPGVVDLVSRRQELALLDEAIQSLPERCRQVFLLRKIQGLSQREIAARLGISENTVETLVGKGARRCADYLGERGVTPSHSSRHA